MKFATKKVIESARRKITHLEEVAEQNHANALTSYDTQRQAWLSTYRRRYLEVVETIEASLADGDPVTSDMISGLTDKNGYKFPVFDRTPPEKKEADTEQLKRLIATLEAMTDEYITRAELKELGFSPTEIF